MELKDRLRTETPIWFKRIIKVGVRMAGVGTALLAAQSTIPNFHLPLIMEQSAQWMIVAGLVAAAVAKTAKQDSNEVVNR